MKLICKVVNIRRLDNNKAVDLIWRADDGSILRDDGATEIIDQINVALDANDNVIENAITRKRDELTLALAQPGVGITIAEKPMVVNDLIGREF
jgi:hypothetical protein